MFYDSETRLCALEAVCSLAVFFVGFFFLTPPNVCVRGEVVKESILNLTAQMSDTVKWSCLFPRDGFFCSKWVSAEGESGSCDTDGWCSCCSGNGLLIFV